MDFSKVKVEVYDFLAVIVPGLLVICELWVTIRGWSRFALSISSLSASRCELRPGSVADCGQLHRGCASGARDSGLATHAQD
jgi:hypothetical protein